MAVKTAIHFSDVSHLDQVNDTATATASLSLLTTSLPTGGSGVSNGRKIVPKFMVVGHRGHGMNILQSPDKRLKVYKENSILSFNKAANHPLDFIEFDVQVTKDNTAVIFHDDFIISEENGNIVEKRVTDLTLDEFFSYGPQRETGEVGKSLLRESDGKIVEWEVEIDDHLCTLEEAFQKVNPCLGFNIELKFDDYLVYEQEYLVHVLRVILEVVYEYARERPVIFSSFQPDAALLMKKLQHEYSVYFLTNGGNEIYEDVRMNSLEEAKKLAISGGLDGVVSEVNGVLLDDLLVAEDIAAAETTSAASHVNRKINLVYGSGSVGLTGCWTTLRSLQPEKVAELSEPTSARVFYGCCHVLGKQQKSFGEAMGEHKLKMEKETGAEKRSQWGQRMEVWKRDLAKVADLKGVDEKDR
ncbi:hypothetical protein SSX86_016090 [Deinandra increscens subsp. villosa]|uniref:glycerophosphodiester phosphodiesterase n=1 Tax=Deinandra increscens subsp. villosa TaxID=3103831 RepID=A0AAP0GVB8_9ASTR